MAVMMTGVVVVGAGVEVVEAEARSMTSRRALRLGEVAVVVVEEEVVVQRRRRWLEPRRLAVCPV